MNERLGGRRLPPLQTLVAAGLVGLGIFLWMFVSKGFIIVAGLGAFGPGILREVGVLSDLDEFQREAARRAGYHAYLVGGLATVSIVSALDWPGSTLEVHTEWIRLILLLMWLSWLFSSMLAYWGPRWMTTAVLLVTGAFWTVFVLGHVVGELTGGTEGSGNVGSALIGLVAGSAIVSPFYFLAWWVHRRPRATGLLMLLVAAVYVIVFRPWRPGGTSEWMASGLFTAAILILPFAACGLALVKLDVGDDDEASPEDPAPAAAA